MSHAQRDPSGTEGCDGLAGGESTGMPKGLHRRMVAIGDVEDERERQHQKWGVQRHDFPVWLTVLAEEVGELSQDILRYRQHRFNEDRYGANEATKMIGRDRLTAMRAESVQVAAVAVAMIEHIDEVLDA